MDLWQNGVQNLELVQKLVKHQPQSVHQARIVRMEAVQMHANNAMQVRTVQAHLLNAQHVPSTRTVRQDRIHVHHAIQIQYLRQPEARLLLIVCASSNIIGKKVQICVSDVLQGLPLHWGAPN